MKKFLSKIFRSSKTGTFDVSRKDILSAYKTREKEIESLRKYDRGEKTITPTNLKNLVQSL